MARAATTTDAFNAIAEPRRREILEALAGGERSVNDLVEARDEGRQRIYSLNGHRLKPIHDWVQSYERTWSERFDRLESVVKELQEKEREQKEEGDGNGDE